MAKIKLKKVREGKNKKIQKDRQRAVRLARQGFAAQPPRLAYNVSRLGEGGDFYHKC